MDDKKITKGKAPPGKPIGYCLNDRHRGFVTMDLLRIHDCDGKRCSKFIRLEHEFWDRPNNPGFR